jgi:hypothetical protein
MKTFFIYILIFILSWLSFSLFPNESDEINIYFVRVLCNGLSDCVQLQEEFPLYYTEISILNEKIIISE